MSPQSIKKRRHKYVRELQDHYLDIRSQQNDRKHNYTKLLVFLDDIFRSGTRRMGLIIKGHVYLIYQDSIMTYFSRHQQTIPSLQDR